MNMLAVLEPAEPIAAADAPLRFPCSSSQQRCWFIDALNPGNPALNVALRWEIKGAFTPDLVERAFQGVVDRHEILRTRFVEVDGQPVQEVAERLDFTLAVTDLTHLPVEERMAEALALGSREAHVPFDLGRLPLIRVHLVRIAEDHAVLLVTVHQICFDGWSIRIIAREFGAIAEALSAGRQADLPDLPMQYGDYANWQAAYFASGSFEDEIDYWRRQLAGAPYFEVPPDHPRPPTPSYRGEILAEILPAALTGRMEAAARRHNVTLFSLGCAVTTAVLHRITGAPEIVVGTQIAGRDDPDLEGLIGVFINNLVIRIDAGGDPSFAEFVGRTGAVVQEALIHQRMPFHHLVTLLNPPRDASRTPLISVNFTVLHEVMDDRPCGTFDLYGKPSLSAGSLYDLNFFLVWWPSGWRMAMEYNPDLFERATAEGILALWRATLERALDDYGFRLSSIEAARRATPAGDPELTVIEATLADHPTIAEAAAVRHSGEERAYAYAVPAPGTRAPLESLPAMLMQHLGGALPPAQRPRGVSILLALPRRADGTFDRAALPAPPVIVPALAPPPAAPANAEVEAKLAAIWRDILQVPEIGPDADFFALGGHSLLAVRMIARVAATFGARVNVVRLFQQPTLRGFASLIAAAEPPAEDEDWRIVRIQPKGERTPIIAINNTVAYYNLARKIGTDRPFIGIQLFDPDASRELAPRPFADIAADYVRTIRAARPNGPYILMGLCVAGALAYAAADQLRREGEDVPLVVMADTWLPNYLRRLPFPRGTLFRWSYRLHVARHQMAVVRAGKAPLGEVLLSYRLVRKLKLLNIAAALGLMKMPEGKTDWKNRWFLPHLESARDGWTPPETTADVVVLRSEEMVPPFADPNLGWRGQAIGRLTSHAVPGWHVDMFQDAGADQIAQALSPLLAEVDAAD
jgi:thioesterase domain-containing protein